MFSKILRKIRNRLVWRNSEAGFTLVEIIVVFSVIGILSTIGVAAFVNYSKSQTLQTSYLQLMTNLNLARSNSLNQIKPSVCETSGVSLQGYEVTIDVSSESYTLNAVCGNLGEVVDPITTFTLPPGISFDPGTAPSIFFPILNNKNDGGQIIINGYGSCRSITVDGVGAVIGETNVCDFTPSPSPSASVTPTPTPTPAGSTPTPTPTPASGQCTLGDDRCSGTNLQTCVGGSYITVLTCPAGTTCNASSFTCAPNGGTTCGGQPCSGICIPWVNICIGG